MALAFPVQIEKDMIGHIAQGRFFCYRFIIDPDLISMCQQIGNLSIEFAGKILFFVRGQTGKCDTLFSPFFYKGGSSPQWHRDRVLLPPKLVNCAVNPELFRRV